MKVREYYDDYWMPGCESRLRECTVDSYKAIYRKSIDGAFGHMEIEDVKPKMVDEWLGTFSSVSQANSHWSVFKALLNRACRDGVAEHVCTNAVRARQPHRDQQPVLTDDEIRAMLRAFRGMALIRLGRKDAARECLVEAAQSADEAAANLARGLLE